MLLICDGENNGNAAFGTIFGAGNKYGKVESQSKVDMLSGLRWGADPLPASMSSNSKSEWLPPSMLISTCLLERMFWKNAMSYQPSLSRPLLYTFIGEFGNCVGSDNRWCLSLYCSVALLLYLISV